MSSHQATKSTKQSATRNDGARGHVPATSNAAKAISPPPLKWFSTTGQTHHAKRAILSRRDAETQRTLVSFRRTRESRSFKPQKTRTTRKGPGDHPQITQIVQRETEELCAKRHDLRILPLEPRRSTSGSPRRKKPCSLPPPPSPASRGSPTTSAPPSSPTPAPGGGTVGCAVPTVSSNGSVLAK